MTTSDVVLIVFSVIVIGGMYLIGRHARKASREDAVEKNEK